MKQLAIRLGDQKTIAKSLVIPTSPYQGRSRFGSPTDKGELEGVYGLFHPMDFKHNLAGSIMDIHGRDNSIRLVKSLTFANHHMRQISRVERCRSSTCTVSCGA